MQTLGLALVVAASLWLIGVALLMAVRPDYCLYPFDKMAAQLEAGNQRVQFIEQGTRMLAGLALIVRAPESKLPYVFEIAGWVLVGISALILLAPIRWHGWYGAFWVKRLSPAIIRVLSPVPAIAGAGLIYAAI